MARLFDDSSLATAAHILTKGPVARADIARSLELSPATLTRLVRPLLSRSLVHETSSGMSPTGMGRPTQLLEVPVDEHSFVGINLTGSDIHVVHTNTHAEILDALTQPIPSTDVSQCAAEIRHLISTVAPGATAAAISLGGRVDGTVVRSSRFLGWDNIDLARELDLTIPLTVINDVSGLTMLELWFGLGRNCEDFLIITVGAGIGHGMVHGLRAVRSPLRGLGMTAHIPLAGAHGVCQYGHIGCANGALTVPAVISRARSGRAIVDDDGRPASADELIALAQDGDQASQRAIREFATNLAVYVQTVASAALVRDVVLDGEGVCLLETPWADNFQRELTSFSRPDDPHIRVHQRSGSFDRWAQGAATAAIVQWLVDSTLAQ